MTGLSWGGFNLFGDRKSVEEVQRLLRTEARVNALQDEVYRLQILLDVEKGKNAETTMGYRE
jgi:hypothetical protein